MFGASAGWSAPRVVVEHWLRLGTRRRRAGNVCRAAGRPGCVLVRIRPVRPELRPLMAAAELTEGIATPEGQLYSSYREHHRETAATGRGTRARPVARARSHVSSVRGIDPRLPSERYAASTPWSVSAGLLGHVHEVRMARRQSQDGRSLLAPSWQCEGRGFESLSAHRSTCGFASCSQADAGLAATLAAALGPWAPSEAAASRPRVVRPWRGV